MLLSALPHHDTGGFTSHRKFLADKEYGEALDTLVKACSDMLLISPDGKRIFLGKRLVQPQPDWWFVGGRIFPGETPARSCCRLLKRELGIEIDPARLNPVCCQSLAWGMREVRARWSAARAAALSDARAPRPRARQQLPKENGTTDSQVVLSLRLTESEVEKVVLDPKEYETSAWVEPAAILAGSYHPALQFAVKSLLARLKLEELAAVVAAHPANDVLSCDAIAKVT
jgi:ADP-ribose pyrophosphatase YjhB (NUDIX family)